MIKTLQYFSNIWRSLNKFFDEDVNMIGDGLFDDSNYKICFYLVCLTVIRKLNICIIFAYSSYI